jgi:hypothetical protein
MHAFVIRAFAGLAQLQLDHARPVATMPMRQGYDPRTEYGVAIRRRRVPQR